MGAAERGGPREGTAGVCVCGKFGPGEPGAAWRAPMSAGPFKGAARGGFADSARGTRQRLREAASRWLRPQLVGGGLLAARLHIVESNESSTDTDRRRNG